MIGKDVIIRHLSDIASVSTMHGNGAKRVLVSNNETETLITQVAITELKAGENVEPHFHPTMEEDFIFLEGECEATVDGNVCRCNAGTFLKVPAKTEHSLCPATNIKMITIGIATE